MLESLPDIDRLTQIFSQATAPTFFLGAVAGFVSLMIGRLSDVSARLRTLEDLAEDHPKRARLEREGELLRERARHLNTGIYSTLFAGICATALLADIFVSELLALRHAYFAPTLFTVATLALGWGLIRFTLEARLIVQKADEAGRPRV